MPKRRADESLEPPLSSPQSAAGGRLAARVTAR